MSKFRERVRAIKILKEIGELGITTGDLEWLERSRRDQVRPNENTQKEASDERKS